MSLRSYLFFTHPATTEIYTLSLHDALPILTLGSKYAPFGYVPAEARGMPAYLLSSGTLELAQTPKEGMLDDMAYEGRSEEHTSELQSQFHLVCRLLLEKKKNKTDKYLIITE